MQANGQTMKLIATQMMVVLWDQPIFAVSLNRKTVNKMSQALLCDRCGKKMVKFVGLRLESKWSMFAMKYDLCPNCTEDFRKFMKKKEREENAAD